MRKTLTQVVIFMFICFLFMGGVNIVQNVMQNLQKTTNTHTPAKKHILAYD